jgi:hypothetical protein
MFDGFNGLLDALDRPRLSVLGEFGLAGAELAKFDAKLVVMAALGEIHRRRVHLRVALRDSLSIRHRWLSVLEAH